MRIWIIATLVLLPVLLLASEVDTAGYWRPNPTTAAILSITLPGAGQIYNHSYWKAPIAMALEGYTIWVAVESNSDMRAAEDLGMQYEAGTAEYEAAENDWINARERRNIHIWLFAGAAFLSTIDAFVDAHLYSWTREMSTPVEPRTSDISLIPIYDRDGGVGLAMSLRFNTP